MDNSNNTIEDISHNSQPVNLELIKECREELIKKFGADNHHLHNLACFWYDVDKENKKTVSIDEFKKYA